MKGIIYITISLLFLSCSNKNKIKKESVSHKPISSVKELSTIAFGSCNKQNKPQPIWSIISKNKPELWVWLGDIIYGDTPDTTVLKNKYALQKANINYQKFISKIPTIGIWDDHDYGKNDAGKEWRIKKESKNLLLDFLDVPSNSNVREREGAYQAYTFGNKNQKTKIILLDSRYFRDSIIKKDKAYLPNDTGDVLGETQWTWLEKELADSSIQLFIIGNGIQFLSKEHPYEKWGNFPTSRERLFKLLGKQKKSNMILLSGDRHHGEIAKIKINDTITIHEVTASGLTHTHIQLQEEKNEYRVGNFVKYYHFGLIEIDWQAKVASLQLRGMQNQIYERQNISF